MPSSSHDQTYSLPKVYNQSHYTDQITSRHLFALLHKCKNESNVHKPNVLQWIKNWLTPGKAKHNVSEELHPKKLHSWIILRVFLDISVGVGEKPTLL